MKIQGSGKMDHMTLVASFLCAIAWTMVAGTTTTIGENSLTCITFDAPLLKWNGDFNGANGIWLENFGVEIQKDCGLNGDCGRFKDPSKIKIPFFSGNDFFDFSASVWFKREAAVGCWPVLVSNGDCDGSTIQITSVGNTELKVTVMDSSGMTHDQVVPTSPQIGEWRHVVVAVHVNKVNGWGSAKVYVDGEKVGEESLFGKMPPALYPMYVGANKCGTCNNHYYNGLMDSISFARYALTDVEVQELYESRGLCIGLPGKLPGDCGNTWALIVAGSHEYDNYRHQSDACHAYRILRNRGIPAERIVLMMYDDIANHPQNPIQGQIFNRPNGPNVYEVIIDYTGTDVTAANFLKILRGDAAAMSGIGSGKVINSVSDDNVFVFYTNHGTNGLLSFPTGGPLTATALNNALVDMHSADKYRQMVLYIEACRAGSMFHNILPTNIQVYATTASSPSESSYAHYYSAVHNTWLGDEYSIHWMEDSDVKDLEAETIYEQFLIVKALTVDSVVHEYGQLSVSKSPVADFQTGKSCYQPPTPFPRDPLFVAAPSPVEPGDGVLAEDVPLATLRRRLGRVGSTNATILAEIEIIKHTRVAVDTVFSRIAADAGWTGYRETMHDITDFVCYEDAVALFLQRCFNFSQDQYAMLQLQSLVNMCEEGIPSASILQSIRSVCNDGMDRSFLPDRLSIPT